MIKTEKVFATRNTREEFVFLWRHPDKGLFEPVNVSTHEKLINWQRSDRNIDNIDFYHFSDFEKKYGTLVEEGQKLILHIKTSLLDNQDYKIISDNPNRKK